MEEITLYDMLNFRDKKAELQNRMLHKNPDGIVVSLGMNIPGPIKRGPLIYQAFTEGKAKVKSVLQSLAVIQEEFTLDEPGGYAVIFLVCNADCLEIKQKTVELEETHLLGRLFDIDVINQAGCTLTRQMVGSEKRKCLLCGCDAKICGRNRTHTVDELQKKVFTMIESWLSGLEE